MIALTIGLAILVGVALGLLGGGGSILMVPLLAYVGGMEAKAAIAASLLVVGSTSAVAAVSHARAGRVRWRIGLIFGAAGMAGAYLGGSAARFVPGNVLLIGFAVVMIAAAIAMLRRRPCGADCSDLPTRALPLIRILAIGSVVGLVSGLVGAGGGFLLVPALTLLAGLPMPVAVGTSLVVIAMQSAAGFLGHLGAAHIDWPMAAAVTVAAILGSLAGGRLTSRIDAGELRALFGWFVLLMAALMLAQQIAPVVGAVAASLTVLAFALRHWRGRHRFAVIPPPVPLT